MQPGRIVSLSSSSPKRPFPHVCRALAHVRHVWRLGALAPALLALAACGDAGTDTRAAAEDVAPLVAEIEAAFEPVPPASTSDVQDRALNLRRTTLERLRARSPELGRAAWKRFGEIDPQNEELRIALLDVACHSAPEVVETELVRMVTTYGPQYSLRLRTHAVRFLAETAPARAVEILAPLLREPQRAMTYPPQETLVDCWIVAARKQGALDDRLLAEVAIGLEQPADARYRAIEELGRVHTPVAVDALRLVLTESGSDGYVRRKAAQAVVDGLPRDEACALLAAVADREVDQMFLVFLADMLEKHCP